MELKPCPFCGSLPQLNHSQCYGGLKASYIFCPNCGCKSKAFEMSTAYGSDDKAIETWNRRADAAVVIHAKWKDNGNKTVSCSHCATWFPKERKPYLRYCGWCGAKIDG